MTICVKCFFMVKPGFSQETQQDAGQRICGECLEDLLDRLERRALNATELQQVMVLDARLEKWTMMQCDPWTAVGGASLY
jgi:hypothetical protein